MLADTRCLAARPTSTAETDPLIGKVSSAPYYSQYVVYMYSCRWYRRRANSGAREAQEYPAAFMKVESGCHQHHIVAPTSSTMVQVALAFVW